MDSSLIVGKLLVGVGVGEAILTDIDDLMVVYSPVCMLKPVCEVWGYIVRDILPSP